VLVQVFAGILRREKEDEWLVEKGNSEFAKLGKNSAIGKKTTRELKTSKLGHAGYTYIQLLNFVTNRFLRIERFATVDCNRVEQLFLHNDFLLKSSGDGRILAPVEQIVPACDQLFN
jgi:hypothetical protein